MDETITINKDEYEALVEDSDILECLRAVGVDNRGGWDDAMELYHEGENNG